MRTPVGAMRDESALTLILSQSSRVFLGLISIAYNDNLFRLAEVIGARTTTGRVQLVVLVATS